MRKKMKRGLGALLTAAMIFGLMAVPAGADETDQNETDQPAGNQLVSVDLWKAASDEASMGNVATDNNQQALYNPNTNTLQIATNPVDVSGYRSAVAAAQYDTTGNGDYADVTTLTTGTIDTGTKNDGINHTVTYLSSFEIVLPDYITKQGVEYIPLKMSVPYTPMDVVVGTGYLDARLRIDWNTVTSTDQDTIVPNTEISSGEITGVDLRDSATGITLNADTSKVNESAVMTVETVTSGADYEAAKTALADVSSAFRLYRISLSVAGQASEPMGAVNVTFPFAGSDLSLYRINDNGTKTVLRGEGQASGYTILTSSLGLFAVIGGEPVQVSASGFTDTVGHWAEENIDEAVSRGLFNGTSDTTFDPQNPMTCGMLLTVLYRIEGEPAVQGTSSYPTVQAGSWYEDAVIWAEQNGIIGDYGPAFDPAKNVTREEMATMLYRSYALHNTPEEGSGLSGFSDAASVSGWAEDAVSWAVAAGIITGRTDTTIVPEGESTRAEVATLFCRYLDYCGK